jgi:CheY-like chemotaxis protein
MEKVNILLVEDNDADVLLTKLILQQAGVENGISVARDGAEAIEFLSKLNQFSNAISPDLVLLDINLPKKNGKEVLHFIKNELPGKPIPVMMYTSSTLESDKQFCYENKVDLYLVKPTLIEDFEKVINIFKEFITTITK